MITQKKLWYQTHVAEILAKYGDIPPLGFKPTTRIPLAWAGEWEVAKRTSWFFRTGGKNKRNLSRNGLPIFESSQRLLVGAGGWRRRFGILRPRKRTAKHSITRTTLSNTDGPRESLHSNEYGRPEPSSIGEQLAACPIGICVSIAGTWNLSFSDARTGNDLHALFRLERQFFGGWSQHTSRPPSRHRNERFHFDWGLCAVDIPGGDCAT